MADVMNINNPRVAEGGGEGSEEGSSVDDGRDHLIRRASRVHADSFLGEDIASLAGDKPRGNVFSWSINCKKNWSVTPKTWKSWQDSPYL